MDAARSAPKTDMVTKPESGNFAASDFLKPNLKILPLAA
jgi:hypothetical protein